MPLPLPIRGTSAPSRALLLLGALALIAGCVDPGTGPDPRPAVARVDLVAPSQSMQVGDSMQVTAIPRDASGVALPDTVRWASSDSAVVRVSPTGLVRAVGGGAATISASAGGKTGELALTVAVPVAAVVVSPDTGTVDVGSTLQLSASTRDAAGNPLEGRTLAWSSLDTARATVSASGLVTGRGEGSVGIVVTSEGRADTATLRVRAPGTEVAGVLSASTRWTKAAGPYRVTGNILISSGVTLTIDPGTRVLFEGRYYVRVDGELIAVGTPSDSIVFTSAKAAPAAGDWSRIWFTSGSTDARVDSAGAYLGGSAIRYAVISHGGAIHFDASSPFFANNRVQQVTGSPPRDWPNGAIWACNSSAVIAENVIQENPLSGIVVLGGGVRIRRNLIRGNRGDWGGAIFFANANCAEQSGGVAVVEDNRIVGNRGRFGGAIALYSGAAVIRHNEIRDNVTTESGAVLATFSGASPEITFNEITGNSSTAAAPTNAFYFRGPFSGILQNNNVTNPTTHEIRLGSTGDVRAPSNHWGVGASELPARIWDYHDDFELGRVLFEPVLTSRVSQAGPR